MFKKIIASLSLLVLLAGCTTLFHSYHADKPSVDTVGNDKVLSFKILDENGGTCGRFSLDHNYEVIVYEKGLYDVNVISKQVDSVTYVQRADNAGRGSLVLKLREHLPMTVCAITDEDWNAIAEFAKDWKGPCVFSREEQ